MKVWSHHALMKITTLYTNLKFNIMKYKFITSKCNVSHMIIFNWMHVFSNELWCNDTSYIKIANISCNFTHTTVIISNLPVIRGGFALSLQRWWNDSAFLFPMNCLVQVFSLNNIVFVTETHLSAFWDCSLHIWIT